MAYLTEPEIKSIIRSATFWTVIAIVPPAIAYFCDTLRPSSETLGIWFQRSGSLMTALSIIADLKIFQMHQILHPVGFVDDGFNEFKEQYLLWYKAWVAIGVSTTITGTVIWGYGDIFLEYMTGASS